MENKRTKYQKFMDHPSHDPLKTGTLVFSCEIKIFPPLSHTYINTCHLQAKLVPHPSFSCPQTVSGVPVVFQNVVRTQRVSDHHTILEAQVPTTRPRSMLSSLFNVKN